MMFEEPGRFPKTAKYISEELPKVIDVHRITQNMQSYGKLNHADFKAALDPYKEPFLMVGCAHRISWGEYKGENQILGLNRNWMIKCDDPRYIYFETDIISTFEYAGTKYTKKDSPYWAVTIVDRGRGKPKNNLVRVLGAVLLSALVDWGIYTKTGDIEPSASANFQRAVYGRPIGDGS